VNFQTFKDESSKHDKDGPESSQDDVIERVRRHEQPIEPQERGGCGVTAVKSTNINQQHHNHAWKSSYTSPYGNETRMCFFVAGAFPIAHKQLSDPNTRDGSK
jgi:hypothetical protein